MPWLTGGRLDLVRRDERPGGVATGHTDAAVIYGAPSGNTRLRTVELGTEDRVAAMGPRHPLARRRRPHWAELAGHALVVNKLSGTVGPALWPPGARPAVARSGSPTAPPPPLPPQRQTPGGAAPAGPGPGSGRTSGPAAAANSAPALCAGSDMPPGPPFGLLVVWRRSRHWAWSTTAEPDTGPGLVTSPGRYSCRSSGGHWSRAAGNISSWRSLARPCGGDTRPCTRSTRTRAGRPRGVGAMPCPRTGGPNSAVPAVSSSSPRSART
ncbi:LysR family transcriptional regulator substrate-binding protein [Streptomyces sp. NPDC014983]|uniref:LysR family transcriptional regulator substrate-binding protein n=1 Tax=Streptomyces sp. NPDC014983 TaxID=3364933 RepID=UPI0036F66993